MRNGSCRVFVVEGEVREPQIIHNLCNIHFRHSGFRIITLPAGQNIYMLWKLLKKYEFEVDLIEILREMNPQTENLLAGLDRDDFSEVFLFFDYDGHQDNLASEESTGDVIEEMLENFDNETEKGKLYINYPMVEALRDFMPGLCGSGESCYCDLNQLCGYKHMSAERGSYNDFREYTFEIWREALKVFGMRVSCLFDEEGIMDYDRYCHSVSPCSIYHIQRRYIRSGRVFVLSAFPQFLLDYFTVKFWNVCIGNVKRCLCDFKRG